MSGDRWLEIVAAMWLWYFTFCGLNGFERWAERRYRSRRSALERRARARRRGGIELISYDEFRARHRALLEELERSDPGRAVVAMVDYGRRAARERPHAS